FYRRLSARVGKAKAVPTIARKTATLFYNTLRHRMAYPDPGAAHAYRHLLASHDMRCSMSRKANCWDNAPMESFFGSMKTELDDASGYQKHRAARPGRLKFIEGAVPGAH